MRLAALYSALLHIFVLLVIFFGLPRLDNKPLELLQPIAIEVVQIGEETTALTPKSEAKVEEKPEVEPKPVEKLPPPEPQPSLSPPQPEPQPSREPEPLPEPLPEPTPEPVLPEPEPESKPKPEPEPVLTPTPEPSPEKLKEKPKEKPKEKEEPKPKPKKPKKPKKETPKAKPKKKQELDFASVLKNLKKSKPNQRATEDSEAEDKAFETSSHAQAGKIDTVLTMSELDALRRQMKQCWNIPAGIKEAKNMVVEIHISANPDGTVRKATIVNTGRMGNDPSFRTAAESALRAVLNPQCSPLKLPLNKYDDWKEFTFRFDPKEML